MFGLSQTIRPIRRRLGTLWQFSRQHFLLRHSMGLRCDGWCRIDLHVAFKKRLLLTAEGDATLSQSK